MSPVQAPDGGTGSRGTGVASSTHGSPAVWIVVAVVAVVAAVMIWRLPTTITGSFSRPVGLGIEFDYSAATAVSDPIHRGEPIRFGDPLFLELNDAIEARMRVDGLDRALGDTAALEVSVSVRSEAGWSQTLVGFEPVELGSNPTVVAATVDFARALAVADRIDRATQITGMLTVVVAASVELGDGRRETAEWIFELNDRRARVAATTMQRRSDEPESPGGPMTVLSWIIEEPIERTGLIEAGPVSLRRSIARVVMVMVAAVAVAVAVSSVVVAWRARRRGEAAWLVARHRAHLVEVGEGFHAPGEVVELGSFAGLVAVGAGAQQSIVFDADDGAVVFYVFDGPQAYCYRASDRSDLSTPTRAPIIPPPFAAPDSDPGVSSDEEIMHHNRVVADGS